MKKSFFQIRQLKSISSDGFEINNINLDLEYGEVFAVVSNSEYEIIAFMEAISGLAEPIEGKITFKGMDADHNLINNNSGISFLYRKSYLFNHMTVAENISLPVLPKMKGSKIVNWSKIKSNAEGILKELNFQVDYREMVCNLTKEQKKLVAIARAFNNKPEIVIMCNPIEGLDSKSIQNLYEIIRKFKTNQGSVIYLTQHWEEALKVADRISVLADGQIKRIFSIEDIIRNPQELLDCLGYYTYKKDMSNIEPEVKEVLDSVLKAAEFITSEYELKDVLSLLSGQVVKFMNSDGCIIHLIDEETKTVIDRFELKTNEELYATLKDEVVIRIAGEENFFYSNMHENDFASIFSSVNNVKTVVCIPLLVRTRVIGVMQIYYEKYYAYSEEQLKYLKTFAKHATIAIEDTKLLGRSALLRESHHRIKNNLQSIINLISIQKQANDEGQNEALNNTLDDIISRIKSIAIVHDLLSKDKKGRSVINIKEIIEVISDFSKLMSIRIITNLYLEDILIPYSKATSIALIVNELITNCIKHAFKDGNFNIISISCRKENELIILEVEDNGKGFDSDFDIATINSLGLSIVTSIINHEFKGRVNFIKKEEGTGTKVQILLPKERILIE